MTEAPAQRNLRLFVAIDPPELVRRRLSAVRDELKRAAGHSVDQVRWVEPGSVHLTLQFLGAVPQERLAAVQTAVAETAAAAAPVQLELRGTGAFPSARRARVLWAGVAGEVEALARVVAALGLRLGPLGYPPEERPFSPHLTLGRAKDQRGIPGLAAALARCADGPGARWPVDELILFQSHLSPRGARYEALSRARLGAGAT